MRQLLSAVLCLFLLAETEVQGQTPPTSSGLFDALKAADNLRAAAEALERFGASLQSIQASLTRTIEVTSGNLATMSSGFDPLGLQNAFRAIQQQNDMIGRQQALIQKLQNREIQRLKRENRRLRQRAAQ